MGDTSEVTIAGCDGHVVGACRCGDHEVVVAHLLAFETLRQNSKRPTTLTLLYRVGKIGIAFRQTGSEEVDQLLNSIAP